ncbi:MAG: Asp-tRNA(Asn)/Glu-tRNA(Gln) amidotransferase subunit GatC [Ruminococcus sp.]
MITKKEIEKIAALSKLFIHESELDKLRDDMQSIINFADTVNEADIDGGEFDNINGLSNAFRDDTVLPSTDVEEILKNAPEKAQDYFLVRKRA